MERQAGLGIVPTPFEALEWSSRIRQVLPRRRRSPMPATATLPPMQYLAILHLQFSTVYQPSEGDGRDPAPVSRTNIRQRFPECLAMPYAMLRSGACLRP